MDTLKCRRFREVVLEADASVASGEHAAECAACAAWLRRHGQREGVLRSLPRLCAPEELRGLVVSAIHAGERQARAVRALQGLGRLEQPDQLERRVQSEVARGVESAGEPIQALAGRQLAPAVLDRLVIEELSDPAKARVARFVGSVPRLAAPPELAQRVADELARPVRHTSGTGWWIAAAAALVLAALAPIWVLGESRVRPFRVEYSDSFASLSPMSRGLMNSVSSGMLDRVAPLAGSADASQGGR